MLTLFMNLWRAWLNAWRRILRRRVDWVWMEISGGMPEFATPLSFVRRRVLRATVVPSVLALRRQFERVAADQNVKGVLLRVEGLHCGWATLQTMRADIGRLRASGKRVIAFLTT